MTIQQTAALLALARSVRGTDFSGELHPEELEETARSGQNLNAAEAMAFDFVYERLGVELQRGIAASVVPDLPSWRLFWQLREAELLGDPEEETFLAELSDHRVFVRLFAVEVTLFSEEIDVGTYFKVRVQANLPEEAVEIAKPVAEANLADIATRFNIPGPWGCDVIDAVAVGWRFEDPAEPQIFDVGISP